jgi:gliding motility-associated lipoprotein GldH
MSIVRLSFVFSLFAFISCTETGLYEKVDFIPNSEWKSSYTPEFKFEIKDTSSQYQLYFIIRHTDAYEYNNIWVLLNSRLPGDSADRSDRFDIQLANDKGWLGSGMDDIYDHRVLLYREPIRFANPGTYMVRFKQEMRINPLKHVYNVGLRLEKLP